MSFSNPYEYWIRSQLAGEICLNEALVDIIHNKHRDPTYKGLPRDGKLLYSEMLNFKKTWQKKLSTKVVSIYQWDVMCPASGITNSESFDTTTNVVVIRYNLPGFAPPSDPKGWEVKLVQNPFNKADFCLEARMLRNETKHGTISDMKTVSQFYSRWDKFEAVLIGLCYKNMKIFNNLKTGSFDPYINIIAKTLERKISNIEEKTDDNDHDIALMKHSLQCLQKDKANGKGNLILFLILCRNTFVVRLSTLYITSSLVVYFLHLNFTSNIAKTLIRKTQNSYREVIFLLQSV